MIYVGKESTTRRGFCKGVAGVAMSGALVGLKAKAAPILQRAAGTRVPSEHAADPQEKNTAGENRSQGSAKSAEHLVAVCGLYCGACPMYLATHHNDEQKRNQLLEQFSARQMKFKQEDLLCDGCLSNERVAVFCQKCAIRLCPVDKPSITRCSDCSDFPCSRITNFNNDGMQHHAEVLDNLRHIREMGVEEWAKHEEDRWRCPQCRNSISWYESACSSCGTKRSDRLFRLKQG